MPARGAALADYREFRVLLGGRGKLARPGKRFLRQKIRVGDRFLRADAAPLTLGAGVRRLVVRTGSLDYGAARGRRSSWEFSRASVIRRRAWVFVRP